MKRYTSVAGLAIRLTLRHVLGLFAVVAGFQWVLFSLRIDTPVLSYSVEEIMDGYPGFMGRIGFVALMLVLADGGSEPEEMNRHVLRRRMRSRQEVPDEGGFDDSVFETFEPEPEADDLFMSNPASAFERREDEYDTFDDF